MDDHQLRHVQIECSTVLAVPEPQLLEQMKAPSFELPSIREACPTSTLMRPHAFESMRTQGMDGKNVTRAAGYSPAVGAQLFTNCLASMQVKAGWSAWPEQKIQQAAVGMHGLGFTHGFAHSIKKASMPLFWGCGKVSLNGAEVNRTPLFPNS